jgi:hypothetical protein
MGMDYSKSPAASIKRTYDVQIMDFDARNKDRVDFRKGDYIKQLIKLMSRNTVEVKALTHGLQFFFLMGGAEGFLDSGKFSGIDASREDSGGSTTSGGDGTRMVLDNTNLLAAFDGHGNFVSSALLIRPLSITVPPPPPPDFHGWSEESATKVLPAWDNCPVNLYHNVNYEVKYFGLQVDDKENYYRGRHIMIDIHKQEDTNGCIFIVDDTTPPLPDDDDAADVQAAALKKLNDFEPKFIKDIQAKLGAKTAWPAGTMRVIKMF